MINRAFRSRVLAGTAVTYLLVVLGGAARTPDVAPAWAWACRAAALAVLLLAGAAAAAGGAGLTRRPGLLAGVVAWPLLVLPALLGDFGAPGLAGRFVALHPAVLGALVVTWLAAAVTAAGPDLYHSRLSMFRSQWQVPLYAALSAYVVVAMGTYLRTLGPDAACHGWPLCTGGLAGGALTAHTVQRAATLVAGACLLYTVLFVLRRHKHRPALLVLSGTAIVLFTTAVVLGADAARLALTDVGLVAHLAVAAALIGTLVATAAVGYYAPSLPAIAGAAEAVALPDTRPLSEVARDYFQLTKPRILALLIVTGYAAMWVAARRLPDLALSFWAMLGLAISCGAANAINMWYDRDIDQVMNRTKKRPVPSGRLTADQALAFGIITGALSFVLLALTVNLMSAVLSLAGLLFYVCIYTMWLKRSTPQNIVIGGAAGAVPPLVGWAAVTGQVSWASVIMFLIIFMWTPPHFWALALFRNEDYRRANVPMMPVVKGEMVTKWQILLYALLMIPTTAALYFTGVVGPAYLWVTTALGVGMVACAVILLRERLPVQTWAKRTFFGSIIWLYAVFLVMLLDIRA
jgi:protoheme IX farnesyltransferase